LSGSVCQDRRPLRHRGFFSIRRSTGFASTLYCPRELAAPPRLGRLRLPPRIGGRPVWSSSAQARFAASGVLSRHETAPCGELPATVERAGLRDSRRNGGGGDWPDAGDGRQALATVESSRPHKPAARPRRLRPVLTPAARGAANALGRDGETVSRSNRETYVCEGKTRRWM
jgi:hypothetical protein